MTTVKNAPAEVALKLVELLTPLQSDDRAKALDAAMILLGDTPKRRDSNTQQHRAPMHHSSSDADFPSKVIVWMKQTGVTAEELRQVFHIGNDEVEVIASSLPGKTRGDKALHAYELAGLAKFLSTGDPSFDDKAARSLCETYGCYDHTNHAKYLKNKGNGIAGSKSKGWTLTAPGLVNVAALVKLLTKEADD